MTRFKVTLYPYPPAKVQAESAYAVLRLNGGAVGVVSRRGREWRAWESLTDQLYQGLPTRNEAVRRLGGST